MAIKKPTPPTAPVPPVSPKDQTDSQDSGNATDTPMASPPSKDFGVHITISSPDSHQTTGQHTNSGEHTKQQSDTGKTDTDQEANDGTAKNTIQTQAPVMQQETQVPTENPGINVHTGNQMGQISIWPFVIVFLAAFAGFTLMNIMKSKSPARQSPDQAAPKQDRHEVEAVKNKNDKKDDDQHKHFEIRV
ncbi:MAG: hypothetical protein K6C05_01125 [Anaerovibrio sp.]|uniref:hypothetical protein n=1 Tax=Anaerovibrio sp. TaxID=1872532 RepID=UPI0025E9251E|nr:hypothetical protein [Anaerovibrio sp.]MCR5175432.1 hypothetical protein [Anaerovibrio sp.]